jgi:pimeloyl-ACP methyl ester carboxylesterase
LSRTTIESVDAHAIQMVQPADVQSVLVAGHSMGGHGAWLLATVAPDLVRAVNPNAGWLCKEFYGDSNTLFLFDSRLDGAWSLFFDRNVHSRMSLVSHACSLEARGCHWFPTLARLKREDARDQCHSSLVFTPLTVHNANCVQPLKVDHRLRAVLEASVAENCASNLASNLRGTAVYARVGAADKTVPPWFSRRMIRLMSESEAFATKKASSPSDGKEPTTTTTTTTTTKRQATSTATGGFRLDELPEKEHWWWDTATPNDGGAVNDPAIRKFFAAACTAGHSHRLERFTLTVLNPGAVGAMQGVQVLQQLVPYQRALVHGVVSTNRLWWEITTENVKRLSLAVDGMLGPPSNAVLRIDGQTINIAALVQNDATASGGATKGNVDGDASMATLCVPVASSHFVRGAWEVCDTGRGERGTVRVFRHTFSPDDDIGSHVYSLQANLRVANDIPLGGPLLLLLSP